MPTILVIEDDRAIREGISDALRFSGYEVRATGEGKEGMRLALRSQYRLLLLDLVLPYFSGLDILKALRAERAGQAVIILSARGEEQDRVNGLALGADDYVVKPFSVRELLARIDAVLRRTAERPPSVATWAFPGGQADFARHELRFDDGSRVELSTREAELLRYLAANPGRAVSRDEILQQVWKLNPKGLETRTVDMHIANLRSKLGAAVLVTVRGRGYMLAATAKTAAV